MASEPSEDYYSLLGVEVDIDRVQLRRVWRRLALRWHPDRAGDGATATFQKLSVAYAVLSDPIARAAYDRRRRAAEPAGAGAPRSAATTIPAPPQAARRPAPAVMLTRLCGHLS